MPTVSIYVPQMILDVAEKEAAEKEISLSKVLLGKKKPVFTGNKVIDPGAEIFKRLDRIEAKIDKMMCGPKVEITRSTIDPVALGKGSFAFNPQPKIKEKKGAK